MHERLSARDVAAWSVLALYVGMVSFAALRPPSDGPGIVGLDKLLHAGAFAVLMVLALLASRGRHVGACLAGCLAFGGVIELAQWLMPYGREPSLADMAANGVGIALGLLVSLVSGRIVLRG